MIEAQLAPPDVVSILVPIDSGLRVSEDLFERLCALNRNRRLERTSTEELIVMMPSGMASSRRLLALTFQLGNWDPDETHGVAFGSSAGFTLPNGAIRNPRAAWLSKPRWDALSRYERERFAHIAPDFVIEVASPSDRLSVLREKMREYIMQGVRLGWLIDPQTEQVVI